MNTPFRPVFASILHLALLAGLAQAQQQASPTVDRLWMANCASCHGAQGQGGDKAQSLLDDTWKMGGELRQIFDSVKTGHKDLGADLGAKLTDPQIWGTVNYLHELRAQDFRSKGGGAKPGKDGVYTSQHQSYTVEDVVTVGLQVPWSVEFVPDLGDPSKEPLSSAMLITEKMGRLRVRTADGKLSPKVEDTPKVSDEGQGGLLDVKLHPNFKEDRWIYLSYADAQPDDAKKVMTKIVRGHLTRTKEGNWAWTDERVVFQARPESYLSPGVHYGSRFAFDPKDSSLLYFTIGERGRAEMAQDLTRPNGKVHRVRDDGTIPSDNPFAANTGPVYKSIWSYGHRNPQGLTFDLEGNLFDTEHGPRGGDELNLVRKGRNYGWPLITFGINYDGKPWNVPWPEFAGKKVASLASDSEPVGPDDLAMPVYQWLPSIAACGLTVSTGGVFPQWKGDLFAGGLAGQTLQRLRVKDGKVVEREEILYKLGRVRDVVCAPDGAIYVVLNEPDHVVKLVPSPAATPAAPAATK